MDRKTLLALVLIVLVVLVWPYYLKLVGPDVPPPGPGHGLQ